REAEAERQRWEQTYAFLERHSDLKLPLVVASPLEFLPAKHGASDEVLWKQLTYAADEEASAKYVGKNTTELALYRLDKAVGGQLWVEKYKTFADKYDHFLVYGDNGWLFHLLERDGAKVEVIAEHNGSRLVRVRLP